MERFIPFENLSKKEQKKINSQKRRDWNGIDPATRVVPDKRKIYQRHPKHRSAPDCE